MATKIVNFFSNNAWAGIGVVIAIATSLTIFFVERQQSMANMDYWILDHPYATRLPSGEMWIPGANGLLVGVRNNGPKVGEGVLVTAQSGDNIECFEAGPGLNLADVQTPTRVTMGPYMCEYYYDYFFTDYYMFILVNRQSTRYSFSISVTGSNVKSTDISSDYP